MRPLGGFAQKRARARGVAGEERELGVAEAVVKERRRRLGTEPASELLVTRFRPSEVSRAPRLPPQRRSLNELQSSIRGVKRR